MLSPNSPGYKGLAKETRSELAKELLGYLAYINKALIKDILAFGDPGLIE